MDEPLKICMISWEFPPRIVGGIARHCFGLSQALVKEGHEVHIFTLDFPSTPIFEEVGGIKIHRTRTELGHPNFLIWTLLFNHFIEKQVAKVSQEVKFDVIHIHDWLTAGVGISSKYFLGKSLISTFHSTEMGRAQGLHNPDSYIIDGIEWWMAFESKKVIVCSDSMKWELHNHFNLPLEKIKNIPNAIEITKYQKDVNRESVRWRFGVSPQDKIVLFIGRLVPQKGVEYLIKAVPNIVKNNPQVKFIIIGDGWSKSYLEDLAVSTGFREKISFLGFLSDLDVVDLTLSADVLVVPSVYEPFGIVALEGMAAGIPVVVTNTGGLAEIVEHDQTGILVYARNPESIAWGINRVIWDYSYSQWLTQNAKRKVKERYNWENIAKDTIKAYEEACRGDMV